jgi:hypothetical protein
VYDRDNRRREDDHKGCVQVEEQIGHLVIFVHMREREREREREDDDVDAVERKDRR